MRKRVSDLNVLKSATDDAASKILKLCSTANAGGKSAGTVVLASNEPATKKPSYGIGERPVWLT